MHHDNSSLLHCTNKIFRWCVSVPGSRSRSSSGPERCRSAKREAASPDKGGHMAVKKLSPAR